MSHRAATAGDKPEWPWINKFTFALFIAVHLSCFAAIWTGVTVKALIICAALYAMRMFFITAGYHRYFSHRSFRTSRVMQFIFAFGALTSAQKGVLWWAAHHRRHHKFSDQPDDVHSPRRGLWWAHLGWIVDPSSHTTDLSMVRDLARFPELRLLDRFYFVPVALLGVLCFFLDGLPGLVVGFVWSTVLVWHGTFTINSLTHVFGRQRYSTGDDSRNHWLLALITFGEGWHNNHHYYQSSVCQGFRWWEVDITYYVLKGMERLGLVRDLRRPPKHVVEGRPNPRRAEATSLAGSKGQARARGPVGSAHEPVAGAADGQQVARPASIPLEEAS